MEFKIRYQNSVEDDFNALVDRVSHSTSGEFDKLYKLCQSFILDVDTAFKEGMEEYNKGRGDVFGNEDNNINFEEL